MGQDRMVMSALFHPPAFAKGAWRLPEVPSGCENDIDHFIEMAQVCEKGMLELFFIADTPAARTENLHIWSRQPTFENSLEPMTALAAIAGATRHIGLGATVSTSFYEPYNIARLFASLDHISRGRAAWNVVTSANDYAARNFGLDKLPPHGERYDRARESLSVVKAYWDTWEDDAFVYDKQRAIFFDPQKFHAVDFKGKHFKLHGGLNVARSPQGHPVIIQAGSSEAGKDFAAETAEIVFGVSADRAQAKTFYDDVKGRMAKFGRPANQLKILSGLSTIVGDSEAEARAKRDLIDELYPVEAKVIIISSDLEVNLLNHPLDEPIPRDLLPKSANHHKAYFDLLVPMVEKGMTLRQITKAYKRGNTSVAGTAAEIADFMEDWFRGGASDGFMLSFTHMPDSVVNFVEKVVPILQKRGLMRTEYAGRTLRENLGIARPENRHAAARVAAE